MYVHMVLQQVYIKFYSTIHNQSLMLQFLKDQRAMMKSLAPFLYKNEIGIK